MPYFLISAISLTGRLYPLTIRRETLESAYIAVQQIIPGAWMVLTQIKGGQ